MLQPVWVSIQWLTARAANTMRQVGLDRFADVVVDRAGLQVVLGHPEGLLDAPQLVVGVDDELPRLLVGQVGGVSLLIPTSG